MAFSNVPALPFDGQTLFSTPQSLGNGLSQFQPQTSCLWRQRRQPSNQEWEMLKDDIRQCYLVENKTLNEVVRRLCSKHGFRPTEKQLTKRLKRWNFRKNKSRKKNESLSKVLVEIQHRRRSESADTHTNNRNICESNGEIDMELQHVGARFQPNPILDISETKTPSAMSVTPLTTHSIPIYGSGTVVTELVQLLSGLNISLPDNMSLFEKPSDEDTPKEYLTAEDITELTTFGNSSEQGPPDIFIGKISLEYSQHRGSQNSPFNFPGYDVDFFSAALVPSLSGELYTFPRSPGSKKSRSTSAPLVEVYQGDLSNYLARFERMRQANFRETHPAMIEIMNKVGNSYWAIEKYCESEVWYRRELSARLRSRESQVSIGVLNAEIDIVDTLRQQGRYQEAKVLQCEIHLNIVNNEVANLSEDLFCKSLESLGWILYHQRYFNDAEVCFREMLQIRLNSLGPWNEHTLHAMRSLADTLSQQKRHDKSEDLVTLTIQLSTEIPGVSQWSTLVSLDDLATTKRYMGQFQESESIYRNLIQRAELALGEKDPGFTLFVHNLSICLYKQDQLEEAENMARRAIDLRAKFQGQDVINTLWTINVLGHILKRKRCYGEAAQCYEKTGRGYSAILGSDSIISIWNCNCLAECYGELGRFEDAIQLLGKFIEEIEIQVASGKEPCWGDGGLPEIQGWIEQFKKGLEYYQEELQGRDITEVDEWSSEEDASSDTEETSDEVVYMADKLP